MTHSLEKRLRVLQHRFGGETSEEIQKLLELGGNSSDGLVRLLKSADHSVALTACWALGRVGSKRQAARLVDVLLDDREDLWLAAAEAISVLSSSDSIMPLMRIMSDGRSARQREAAAYALSFHSSVRGGAERLTEAFVARLENEKEAPPVRAQAAEGLGNIHEFSDKRRRPFKRAFNALIQTLHDPSAEVRFWSAFALGKMRSKGALPALRRLARTDSAIIPGWWSVRREAEDAIRSIES